MIRTLILLVIVIAVPLEAAARTGAFFNPRVSSRSIAFNRQVRVTFTTIPAQLPAIDIVATVRAALDLPTVREHWRLYRVPRIDIHERLKTVEVSFTLQPRHSGTLTLPEVPVRWLDGEQVASFGRVEVSDEIRVGNATIPLPLELNSVAGVAWGTPFTSLRQRFGKHMSEAEDSDRISFTPQDNLLIECRDLLLYRFVLTNPGISLKEARSRFISRWGEPMDDLSADLLKPRIVWVLGWLRITATEIRSEERPALQIELLREDVDDKVLDKRLEENLFEVLDGNIEKAPQ